MALRRTLPHNDLGMEDIIQAKKKAIHSQSTISDHPHDILLKKAVGWQLKFTDKVFAEKMDQEDKLAHFRQMFSYPKNATLPMVNQDLVDPDEDCVYFSGCSLGLMPNVIHEKLDREMEKWSNVGVYGHHVGEMPWALGDEEIREQSAVIVGAKTEEVVLMNALTVNQHLAMVSFYQPTPKRHKILIESKAFPSDHYCVESQIGMRGYNPDESMICIEPRRGEATIRTEDIVALIEEQGHEIALIMLPGVQYYTGQLFDMKKITRVGHKMGCVVGFDLAHAVGNVELFLHEWGVDWAVWCSYKYMNAGAGGIGGLFIHERHHGKEMHRLTGWWSHRMDSRFAMTNVMDMDYGPRGYRISNPPMLLTAALEGSLEVFSKTSMAELRAKSRLLTGYLEMLILHYFKSRTEDDGKMPYVNILTPADPEARGCQLSIEFSLPITEVFDKLQSYGVVCDKRKPGVLRLAPVPLYNSFKDIYRFVVTLRRCVREVCDGKVITNGHSKVHFEFV